MNRSNNRRSRAEQQRRVTKKFFIAFVVVLIVCLAAQITMLARVYGQNKRINALDREAYKLHCDAENLELVLNRLNNRDHLTYAAKELGMVEPDPSQIRVVNLPDIVGDTSAQSAENISAEEMNQ